jgi:hypothetical protein
MLWNSYAVVSFRAVKLENTCMHKPGLADKIIVFSEHEVFKLTSHDERAF